MNDDTKLSNIKYFLKTFETHYIFFLPCELERYQKTIHSVFEKYKTAISKYCAYSNIESIKFLITYGSKKTLAMWNFFEGSVDHRQFKTKGDMVFYMKMFQDFYDSVDNEVLASASETTENTFEQSKTI
jgi:hypothetical protein